MTHARLLRFDAFGTGAHAQHLQGAPLSKDRGAVGGVQRARVGGRIAGRVPDLMNRWNDHVLVRRNGKVALQCAWCKFQAKLATTSGRPALRIRETRLVCNICTREGNADDKRGSGNVALCKALNLSSTEGGATCFYLYHRYFFGSTPVASGAAPAAAADDSELAAPERLDDAMDDAQ